MAITFTPVELDTANGDRRGLLVFSDGKLTAVMCCLDEGHGDEAGRWFVETTFRNIQLVSSHTYDSPEAFAVSLGKPPFHP